MVALDILDRPTLKAIRLRLHERRRTAPYQVFHFIGHTLFDHDTQEGKLLLESEAGQTSSISANELGEILSRHPSFRLAVINACEGASTSPNDAYSGVAQTFLRTGAASAVVAMQYKIDDNTAKLFSKLFYEQLLKGADIDSAVAFARMLISDSENDSKHIDDAPIEWATPVIYMRSKDSRLIDFNEVGATAIAETKPEKLSPSRNDHDGGAGAPESRNNGKASFSKRSRKLPTSASEEMLPWYKDLLLSSL